VSGSSRQQPSDPAAHISRRPRISGPARRRLHDGRFRHYYRRYIAQCLMATITILLVLLALDAVRQTVLVASLGASAFIVFASPWAEDSRPRYLIGGYLVGMLVGCSLSLMIPVLVPLLPLDQHAIHIIVGALATGLAMFVMVVTDTEHPPAASLSLGFILNEWDMLTLAVVLTGIVSISIVKELLRTRLIDLL